MFTASLIVNQFALLSFAVLMIWAAVSDSRSYTIPNKIGLAVVALYPAFVLTSPTPPDWVAAVIICGVVLACGFVGFAFHWIGAGDAKLIAAAALWAGGDLIVPFLVIVALAGGAVSVTAILRARQANAATVEGTPVSVRFMTLLKTRVPYGAAIAAGGVYVAVQRLAM